MYALDVNKFIGWLLPASIRKTIHIAWLNALLAAVKWLHSQLLLFINATQTEINITPQVRVLAHYLNQQFDPTNQTIFIEDAIGTEIVFAFLESENRPVFLPVFLSGKPNDFVVHCPSTITAQDSQIRAFLDKYKLPTKQYEIRYDL